MFAESIPNQRGAVALCPECRAVRSPQQFLIEDDLNRFHLSTPFHSIVHSRVTYPLVRKSGSGKRRTAVWLYDALSGECCGPCPTWMIACTNAGHENGAR